MSVPKLVTIRTLIIAVSFSSATFAHLLAAQAAWKPANASQSGRVAAVTRGDTNLEVFSIDQDGAVSHTYWNGGAWASDMMSPMGKRAPSIRA